MKDFWRESFCYAGLYRKMYSVKKIVEPKCVPFGEDKEQYFLYYEPKRTISNKIVVWIHGGVLLGFLHGLVDVLLAQVGGSGDGDVGLLAGAQILGGNLHDAVGVGNGAPGSG